MADIEWTQRARRDFNAITAWHGRQNRTAGARWGSRIVSAVERLRRFPESGAPVEEASVAGYRELYVGPYRIVYRFDGGTCSVALIVRGVEDIADWLPTDR